MLGKALGCKNGFLSSFSSTLVIEVKSGFDLQFHISVFDVINTFVVALRQFAHNFFPFFQLSL